MNRVDFFLAATVALIFWNAKQNLLEAQEIDRSAFDTSIRIQDDLFMHVNGSWLKNTEIPSDKSNFGAFIALDDLSQERIRKIVEETSQQKHQPGSIGQKVADFYSTYLDEARIESLDLQPIAADLKRIAELKTHADVLAHFGQLRQIGVGSPIGLFVSIDRKNSTQYTTILVQSGTTLPDRDYYLKAEDEKYAAARRVLVDYVDRLFALSGIESKSAGETVLALETRIAEAQWPRVDMRDAEKTYNKFATEQLKDLAGNIPWNDLFQAAGWPEIKEINVMTPSFIEKLDAIAMETSVEDWKTYLQFRVLDDFAPYLPKQFDEAHFALHKRELEGTAEQEPRWKRAVGLLGGALGEAVGELYVAKHFKPEAKARMNELVQNLLKAFDSSIDELSWMTAETKLKAKEKLSKIKTKIGYPDVWRDYSKLQVVSGDLIGNIKRAAQFESQRQIDKLGKPIDRNEWGMTPQTVNAYYNPPMNEIVFPAAILQSPFFSMDAPDALNYGGIGAVIGHEISHAFDDQGSRYDGDGNLKNWWTEADRQAFEALTRKLIDQYKEYEPLPGQKVNGQLTLGENIADLSGLAIAYKAYQISRAGKQPEELEGWNGNQLVFIGWSRVWQRKYRDAEMIRRLATDPHSPSHFRANGPVMNIDAFYSAFDVKQGDKLYKPESERIRIW
jgi:predicted metalloendopeptidase